MKDDVINLATKVQLGKKNKTKQNKKQKKL